MIRRMTFALLTTFLFTSAGLAQTARPSADDMAGTWTRRVQDHRITVTIKPDGLRLRFAMPEGITISLDADYVLTRDNILVGVLRTRQIENKESEKMDLEDRVFHCRMTMQGDALVVSSINGKCIGSEDCMKLMEGRYRKADAQKASRNTQTSNPNRRIQESPRKSEDFGPKTEYEWERIWFTDQPSHLTPEKVHGGIQSNARTPRPSGEWQPVPVMPWAPQRATEKYVQADKADYRTVVIGPIAQTEPKPWEDPPDHAQVLRALSRMAPGVAHLYETYRDDFQITTELVTSRVEPPRFYPLVGPAQLRHCSWKCTVYYTEVIESSIPFPFRCKRPRIEVVYIDKDHLHLCPAAAQTGSGPASDSMRQMMGLINSTEVRGFGQRPELGWWEWLWLKAQPSHMTLERIHGGIQ